MEVKTRYIFIADVLKSIIILLTNIGEITKRCWVEMGSAADMKMYREYEQTEEDAAI